MLPTGAHEPHPAAAPDAARVNGADAVVQSLDPIGATVGIFGKTIVGTAAVIIAVFSFVEFMGWRRKKIARTRTETDSNAPCNYARN